MAQIVEYFPSQGFDFKPLYYKRRREINIEEIGLSRIEHHTVYACTETLYGIHKYVQFHLAVKNEKYIFSKLKIRKKYK
jgi:hypothetical protein